MDKWGKGKFHVVSFDYIKLNTALTATQWPTSSELKIKFDPSLDRSWCQFFKIIKDHGPKNLLKEMKYYMSIKRKFMKTSYILYSST